MNFRIYEYQSIPDEKGSLPSEFEEYLQKSASSSKVIGKINEDEIGRGKGNTFKNSGSSVGILKCSESTRFEFLPKLDFHTKENPVWNYLPHMLETLTYERDLESKLFLDTNISIELPNGMDFVPLLFLSFVRFLELVIENGVMKKYIKKEEDLRSIKGRINFSKHASKRVWDYSKLPCIYNDLSIDNNENQIIFWCAVKLLKHTKRKDDKTSFLEKVLRSQIELLSTVITLKEKSLHDYNKVILTANHSYYAEIMKLCKVVLTERMFSHKENEKSSHVGVNFLIDMNWVFEQYMTSMFEEVVNEMAVTNENSKLCIETQKRKSLCDNGRITIKPDLIIKNSVTKEAVVIIDFKWKNIEKNNNADFYQVICYALSELESRKGDVKESVVRAHLFCASDDMQNDSLDFTKIDEISELFKNRNMNAKIEIMKVALGGGVFLKKDSVEIEKVIKEKIHEYLENLETL